MRVTRTLLATVIALAILVVPAQAGTTPGELGPVTRKVDRNQEVTGEILISPANQRVQVEAAGQVIDRYPVLISNRTDSPQTVDLQVGQVVGSARAEDVVDIRHGVRDGAAAWVEIAVTSVDLRPRETVTIPMRITLPDELPSGDRAFAVSATQRTGEAPEGSGAVPIYRLTSIFALEMPGPSTVRVELLRADVSDRIWVRGSDTVPTATIQYRNDGDRFVRPGGELIVTPLLFGPSFRYPVPEFTIYPEGANGAVVQLTDLPYAGFVTIVANMSNDIDEADIKLGSVWILPEWWRWAAGALGLFALWQGFRVVRWWRARRQGWEQYLDEDDEELDDDDLVDLADDEHPA